MANPPSRKQAWKQAAGPASSSRPVEEAWRKAQEPARQQPPWWKSRRARLGFITSALVVVTGILVWVVLWFWPVPPMHLVAIAPVGDNPAVPPTFTGSKGLEDLLDLASEHNNWGGVSTRVELASDPDVVKRALEVPLLEKAPKTVVVFVSAHGVARFEEGGLVAYLVPQDDNLSNPAALSRLDDLLDALDKLPKKTKKLLLLDVTRVNAHWPLGELHNDFARALEGRAERIKGIDNLVVISSSGEDQRSWESPEWGQTYFTHFVIEGLKGAADGAGTGKQNGRVDALELFHYVRDEVKRAAWHNRARPQTPVKFGDDERARKLEVLSCGAYQPDNSVPGEADEEKHKKDYDDLEKAWVECQTLRASHPAMYAPHLWRRYLDTLLRAEQLLRAGDSATAAKLLEGRKSLEDRIRQGRALKGESIQLSLAMPAALGMRLKPEEKAALARIEKLWQENAATKDFEDKNYEKARADLLDLAKQDQPRLPMLRAALAGQVVGDLARDPEHLLTYGRQFLEILEADPDYRRPAEVHYLMMLRPEVEAGKPSPIDPLLKDKRWPKLLRKSLEVRLLAEQAALGLRAEDSNEDLPAYSEQVLPWIQQTIQDAGTSRRRGEDLLFTSYSERWDEAAKLLDGSRQGYEKAQTIAADLRTALDVRDRALTELPYYTHWVAEQPEKAQQPETEKLTSSTIELWNKVHDLRRKLDTVPNGGPTLSQAASLGKQAREIDGGFQQLQNAVTEAARKPNPHHQDRWHEIEAILSVPFLDADDRLTLLKASREVSRRLFINPDKNGDREPVSGRDATQARALALRQGRLALAVLGEDWPESATIKAEIANADEDSWRRHLTRAGASVGQLLNRLPEEADHLCEQAAGEDDLVKAAALLQTAARYARTIDGAAALTRMKRDPVDEQRRLNLYHLLCWQTRRTYLDWWAELKQGADTIPYFQRAGRMFLHDAKVMMGKPKDDDETKPSKRLQRAAALDKQLRDSPRFRVEAGLSSAGEFKADPVLPLTDEPQGKERYYRLRGPDAESVPGTPVMWVEVQDGLQEIAEEKKRKTVQFWPQASYPSKIAEDRSSRQRGEKNPRHIVHGFFRGHRARFETEVRLYREPDVTLSLPLRQEGGSVAVQTKQSLYDLYGAKDTALSIVLDCSGSMNFPRPKPGPRRFDKAVEALKGVLQDLPKGVMVSLRAFGAKEYDELEDKGGMKLVWKSHPWDPDKIDRQMAKVKSLTPAYATPLLRSIRMASKDFPDDQLESRTIVVITDGGDSNFYVGDRDEDLKEKSHARTITDYLKYLKGEFDRAGIQLIVIGFDVKAGQMPSAEEEKAAEEFREAMKKFGGTYYDAEYAKDNLAEILRRSLLRLYFRVDPDFGSYTSDLGPPGGPISQSDLGELPHPVPRDKGLYLVRVPSTRRLQQRIQIDHGDALLLDLVKDKVAGRPAFRRTVYAKSQLANLRGQAEPVDNWLLAVWQNYQARDKISLQMMATLEKDEGIARSPKVLQQVWPAWYWIEIPTAEAGGAAPSLQIDRLSNYPAPAWGLNLSRWGPSGAPVTLKAWWRETLPKPHGTLVKGPDFQDPFGPKMVNYDWRIDTPPGSVRLVSVTIEPLRLQAVEGGRKEEEVECLMVRLSYPARTGPFFVRWPGWEGGQQHRFYTEAGKYTGIFWKSGESMKEIAQKELKQLDLYSVAQLKDGASQVKELKVGMPNDVWERPTPAPSVHHSRR